jgi:hypothetical protein
MPAFAHNNPIPQIVGPVHPDAVAPGSGAFTLSVYGANFVPGSVVNWNYQPRVTTYVSAHEIQAQILAGDVETNTAGYITVTNPPPGGGSSSASWAQVEVHQPVTTIALDAPMPYGFGYWTMIATDFTRAGMLDIAGEYGSSIGYGAGQDNGAFGPWSLAGPDYFCCSEITYGDFHGDGNTDIVYELAADRASYMRVMFGNGNGNFSQGPSTDGGEDRLGFLLAGDFNQDGKLDVVARGPSYLSTYLGNGDGTFTHGANYLYPGRGLGAEIVSGDVDGDGKLDLIALQIPSISFTSYEVGIGLWFLKGNGDGSFQEPKKIATFSGATTCLGGGAFSGGIALSDLNNDGKLDLVFCNASQIGVMLGNGDGTFQPPSYYTTDTTSQGLFTFSIGDINSDGNQDLIVSEYSDFNSEFVVFLGNGDGAFQAPQVLASDVPSGELGVVLGDFNRDGLLDAIFSYGLGMNVFLQQ